MATPTERTVSFSVDDTTANGRDASRRVPHNEQQQQQRQRQYGRSSRSDADEGGGDGDGGKLEGSDARSMSETQLEMTRSDTYASPITPQTLVYTWRDVNYLVNNNTSDELALLKHVSGHASPRRLIALCGASGAGKTTLLDVLANRKTKGKIEGDILANNKRIDPESLSHFMGYVEQQDLHFTRQTVREAVVFAARTRLPPDISKEDAIYFADHIIEIMGLRADEHRLVGSAEDSANAISSDARKRVSVAVEYAANGSLYFLDEPTSGLDARSALRVMRAVRNLANNNTSVVSVIHQPSYEVFSKFDELLLLRAGGEVVYFGELGPRCRYMTEYFERNGAPPIEESANPADYMLRVIGAGVARGNKKKTSSKAAAAAAAAADGDEAAQQQEKDEDRRVNGNGEKRGDDDDAGAADAEESDDPFDNGIDWVEVWRNSPEAARSRERIEELMQESSGYELNRKPPTWREEMRRTGLVVRRQLTTYWRTPSYNLNRLIMALSIGLIMGLFFLQLPRDQTALNAYVAVLFLSLLYAIFLIQNVMGPMYLERPAFYRETASGTYSPLAYGLALTVAEIPYSVMGAFLVTVLLFFMVGYPTGAYGYFFLMNIIFSLSSVSMGQALSALLPSKVVAVMISGFLIPAMNIFAGFLAPRTAIANWLIWAYYGNPYRYALEGLVVSSLSGVKFTCSAGEYVKFPLPSSWSECSHGGALSYKNVTMASACRAAGVPVSSPGPVACCEFCPVTSGDQVLSQYGFFRNWRWIDIGAMCGWYIGFQVINYVALTYVRHINR